MVFSKQNNKFKTTFDTFNSILHVTTNKVDLALGNKYQ